MEAEVEEEQDDVEDESFGWPTSTTTTPRLKWFNFHCYEVPVCCEFIWSKSDHSISQLNVHTI